MYEPTEDIDLDDDDGETIVMEMAALEALFESNKGEGPVDRAVSLCKQAFEAHTKPPVTLDQCIVRTALAKAAGTTCPTTAIKPSKGPWTTFVFETIATAWIQVACGNRAAVGLISRLRQNEPDSEDVPGGAIELLALNEWGLAVEALAAEDFVTARRHFERAIEVGSQVGSDSNPAINWTYAASFFGR